MTAHNHTLGINKFFFFFFLIVFGYDENSMIVLRRHMHGEEIEVVEAKDTLNCDEFVSYCIEASGPHIQITRLGDPKILMDFTDSVGIPINYRYIGFAGGFDHCVEWRWPVDIIPSKNICNFVSNSKFHMELRWFKECFKAQ